MDEEQIQRKRILNSLIKIIFVISRVLYLWGYAISRLILYPWNQIWTHDRQRLRAVMGPTIISSNSDQVNILWVLWLSKMHFFYQAKHLISSTNRTQICYILVSLLYLKYYNSKGLILEIQLLRKVCRKVYDIRIYINIRKIDNWAFQAREIWKFSLYCKHTSYVYLYITH